MCTVLILCLAPSENPYCKSHYEKGNKGFHSLIYSSCMKFCFLLWNSRAARDKKKIQDWRSSLPSFWLHFQHVNMMSVMVSLEICLCMLCAMRIFQSPYRTGTFDIARFWTTLEYVQWQIFWFTSNSNLTYEENNFYLIIHIFMHSKKAQAESFLKPFCVLPRNKYVNYWVQHLPQNMPLLWMSSWICLAFPKKKSHRLHYEEKD